MNRRFFEIETPFVSNLRNMIADPQGRGIVQVEIPTDHKDVCYILCLYVMKEHRKKGLAASLLQRAEEYGKSKGCTKAVLYWKEEDSPMWVLQWYARNGYSETEFGRHEAKLEKSLITQ